MKKLVGARLELTMVNDVDRLISSSSKYKDRTHVITVALEKLLEEEKGAIQDEQKTKSSIS